MVHVEREGGEVPPGLRLGVIGVLVRGEELLIVQRAPQVRAGGSWCFPGGHVEEGESSAAAVERELMEELGLAVAAREWLGRVRVPATSYVLDVWTVVHVAGELVLKEDEIADARWLSAQAIRELTPILPSNAGVLELLGL